MQRIVADEVANVGNHPSLASLDKKVVPQLLRVVPQSVRFAREESEQRAQLLSVGRVRDAVQSRLQLIETIGILRDQRHKASHPIAVRVTSCDGTSIHASSAGSTLP